MASGFDQVAGAGAVAVAVAETGSYAHGMLHKVELELAQGMNVDLVTFNQELHYERIIVGMPNQDDNARFLARLKEEGAHVVWAPEALTYGVGESPHGTYGVLAQLPPIMCTAIVQAPSDEYRTARLVWFQAEWAFPISPDALAALRLVDWPAVAQPSFW